MQEQRKSFVTSRGGVVTFTPTGLIHRSSASYSGSLAEQNKEAVTFDQPKRGRGRPRKTVR